ncbi:hypothetical protein C3747_197g46 [Trypanosoma cruzi]|uniref:Uncharacterized protein n=2 Tax=Trypanosoma cruzi TaxID=5693 RepID=Q4D4Y7_TRYCC|nr:hypothetical protein, conserved [Trypanosoma cruzi]EAN87587.1 hypothetical protein, conserved [Trypanosoma cruzi]PWV01293.1 hypothetical protein C3747_197g46 [Trypanosoma cruzi]|eukprot:XP_809438.1 hypothetical protein [Trypanosoma cruzi strain CL Brener]
MNLSNYMSSIVSEVQQFGKAYVDSFVSPGEGKDHNEPGSEAAMKSHGMPAGTKTAAAAAVSSFFTATHKTRGDAHTSTFTDDRKKNTNNSSTSSSYSAPHRTVMAVDAQDKGTDVKDHPGALPVFQHASTRAPHDVASVEDLQLPEGFSGPVGSAVERHSSSLSSSSRLEIKTAPALLGKSLRKNTGKKAGKTSRSKFGAVKIQPEHSVTTSTHPTVSPASSPVDSPLRLPPSDNKDSLCQPEEKDTTVAAPGVDTFSSVAPLDWRRRQKRILQLLHASLGRRMEPLASEWVQNALSQFAMNVAVEALVGVAKDPFLLATSPPSSSVDTPSESAWRHAEAELRRCVKRVIPREVFGPYAFVYDKATANDNVVLPGNVIYPAGCSRVTPHEVLHEALLRAQRWCDERRTRPSTLLPSESSSVWNCGISEFLALCFSPPLCAGVKEVQEVTHHSPLQEQELQLERTALDMWIKDVMELFCGMIFRRDLGAGQPVLGTPANEFILAVGNESDSASLDDLENALHDGTAALWVLREAMVLMLLLLWALHSCSACE